MSTFAHKIDTQQSEKALSTLVVPLYIYSSSLRLRLLSTNTAAAFSMSSHPPPPDGPPYYSRLPSVFTPRVFHNLGYWVKLDLVDWVEANKEQIKVSPSKDTTVNAYIVVYLHATCFADGRFPSTAFPSCLWINGSAN
jgi:hypothetical protein